MQQIIDQIRTLLNQLESLPDSIIGKNYYPSDNSYVICLETQKEPVGYYLAGTQTGHSAKLCKIISEPYSAKNVFGNTCTFVNVLYNKNTYRVLYNLKNLSYDNQRVCIKCNKTLL